MMDQAEHRLSKYVDALLERIMVGDCWFTAVDHSGAAIGKTEQAQMAWRARQKAMGIKPSHLDWCVYQRDTGIYAQFELKVGRNGPTAGQDTTMRLLRERRIPTGCAWTLRQFYDLVLAAGFRVHPNAANILVEIETRYAVADHTAELVKTGVVVKKRYAPKKAGPRYTWKVRA